MLLSTRGVAVAVLLACLLLPASFAEAADWYVDSTAPLGGDGSELAPFDDLHAATNVASAGDRILVAAGVYSTLRNLTVNGRARRALLVLVEGVEVIGSGRQNTILRAPSTPGASIFGITAEGVSLATVVRDLRVEGACFQGVNLRGAAPTLISLDLVSEVTGSSSVAMDAREGSAPHCIDVLFDGGHSPLFIEFSSAGLYEDCVVGPGLVNGVAISDADPVFRRCRIEGAQLDTVVLNQGSQPSFRDCEFGEGGRWTVRVASGYAIGNQVDMSGNRWFSEDPATIAAAILDFDDNASLGARVVFLPLADPVATESMGFGAWKSRYGRP